jgi:hypothetical protein
MSKLRQSSPRKRHYTEQDLTQREDPSYPPLKRRKSEHPACETSFQPPAAFLG